MSVESGRWWCAAKRDRTWRCSEPSAEAYAFHRGLDGYAATPLVSLPELAAELGIGFVLAKDESSRLGLPAFKAKQVWHWLYHRGARSFGDMFIGKEVR